MSVKWWWLGALAVAAVWPGVGRAQIEDAGVEVLPDRTYIHKESKTMLKVPLGWDVVAPYRLRKTAAASVLGIEKDDPMVSLTVIWSPIGDRPFGEFIRAAEDQNLGDEYATLVTVYGAKKVGRPTTFKVGPYTVYRVAIDDGPDRDGRFVGSVYLFEAGTGDNRWRVKIRAIYPALEREKYVKEIEEIINRFGAEE
jgi:hypothetical protein